MSSINEPEEFLSTPYATCFTKTGLDHRKREEENEDVTVICEDDDFLFYGIADGQSGKTYCRAGAEAVLKAVANYIKERKISVLSQLCYKDEIQFEITRLIRETLSDLTALYQTEIKELSSTILALGINRKTGEYMTVHLGDGGILGKEVNGTLCFLSAPENGITSRYTYLTSSESALLHLRIEFGKIRNFSRLLLFSDGTEAFCRGTNISKEIRDVLGKDDDALQAADILRNREPTDDATFIVIDCRKLSKIPENQEKNG